MSANAESRELLKKVVRDLKNGRSVAEIFLDDRSDGISLERISEIKSFLDNENPVMTYDRNGRPSELSYNVPNFTSYRGRNAIILSAPELEEPEYDWFKEEIKSRYSFSRRTG